jgi:pantoate--beta-alanine ligase
MVIDLDLDVGVIGAPTLREADGLALSSRNAYLSPEERKIAPLLFAALTRCAAAMRQGMEVQAAVEAARSDLDGAGFVTDYIEVRHAECLTPIVRIDEAPIRLLTAARLGKTRLIDNIAV